METSDGTPGEEAAVDVMADCNFVKADGGVVATASEPGDKMLVLSCANFSCVPVISSCVARFVGVKIWFSSLVSALG